MKLANQNLCKWIIVWECNTMNHCMWDWQCHVKTDLVIYQNNLKMVAVRFESTPSRTSTWNWRRGTLGQTTNSSIIATHQLNDIFHWSFSYHPPFDLDQQGHRGENRFILGTTGWHRYLPVTAGIYHRMPESIGCSGHYIIESASVAERNALEKLIRFWYLPL
jgi:hypothetical protein